MMPTQLLLVLAGALLLLFLFAMRRERAGIVAIAVLSLLFMLATNTPVSSLSTPSAAAQRLAPEDVAVVTPLFEKVAQENLSAALDEYAQQVSAGRIAFKRGHTVVHALGMYAYEQNTDLNAVLAQCRVDSGYACQHGAVMAYTQVQTLREEDVAQVCAANSTASNKGGALACWHGLGHGIAQQLFPDEMRAARFCEKFPSDPAKATCLDAVFTVTVEYSIEDAALTLRLRDRPYAPCVDLTLAWQGPCLRAQVAWFSHISGSDIAAMGRLCAGAPSPLWKDCYENLGEHVRFQTGGVATSAYGLCQKSVPQDPDRCTLGALYYAAMAHSEVLPLCPQLAQGVQKECYELVLDKLGQETPSPAVQAAACRLLPSTLQTRCAPR